MRDVDTAAPGSYRGGEQRSFRCGRTTSVLVVMSSAGFIVNVTMRCPVTAWSLFKGSLSPTDRSDRFPGFPRRSRHWSARAVPARGSGRCGSSRRTGRTGARGNNGSAVRSEAGRHPIARPSRTTSRALRRGGAVVHGHQERRLAGLVQQFLDAARERGRTALRSAMPPQSLAAVTVPLVGGEPDQAGTPRRSARRASCPMRQLAVGRHFRGACVADVRVVRPHHDSRGPGTAVRRSRCVDERVKGLRHMLDRANSTTSPCPRNMRAVVGLGVAHGHARFAGRRTVRPRRACRRDAQVRQVHFAGRSISCSTACRSQLGPAPNAAAKP